jgi:hypothetical protein
MRVPSLMWISFFLFLHVQRLGKGAGARTQTLRTYYLRTYLYVSKYLSSS